MLFDLRGRRRRAVQATYLTLALLMGGGLVFFGIGGDVSGGLFDAFSERSGGSSSDALEERIDRREENLAANPSNEAALKALVRDYHALAAAQLPTGAVEHPEEAKDELQQASEYWQRYLEVEEGKADASLARLAVTIYDQGALNEPEEAAVAMRIVAEAGNDYESYLALVQRAAAAGDKRTADLAAKKAVELAPKRLKKQVRQQAKALQAPPPTEQTPAPQGATPAPQGEPTPTPEQTPEQ
jgi:hypothetical protein